MPLPESTRALLGSAFLDGKGWRFNHDDFYLYANAVQKTHVNALQTLRADYDILSNDYNNLLRSKNDVDIQLAQIHPQLQNSQRRAENAEQQQRLLQYQLDTERKAHAACNTTVENLQRTAEEQTKLLADVQQSKNIATESKRQALERNKDYQQELRGVEGEKESALATNQLLIDRNDRHANKIEELQRENCQLQADLSSLPAEKDELEQGLVLKVNEIARLEHELQSCHTEAEDKANSNAEAEAEAGRRKTKQLKEVYDHYKQCEAKTKAEHEKVVQGMKSDLEGKIGSLQELLKGMRKDKAAVEEDERNARRELKANKNEVQRLSNQVAVDKTARETAEGQCDRMSKERDDTEEKLKTSTKARKDAEKRCLRQLQSLKDERSKWDKKKAATSTESKLQATELRGLREQMERTKDDLATEKGKTSTLENEKTALQGQSQQSAVITQQDRLEIDNAKAEMGRLQSELRQERQATAGFIAQQVEFWKGVRPNAGHEDTDRTNDIRQPIQQDGEGRPDESLLPLKDMQDVGEMTDKTTEHAKRIAFDLRSAAVRHSSKRSYSSHLSDSASYSPTSLPSPHLVSSGSGTRRPSYER